MSVITDYFVGPVKITITKTENNICLYNIEEPPLLQYEENVMKDLISQLLYIRSNNIEDTIIKILQEKGFKDESIEKILYYVKKNILFDVITPLMLDPNIEEIECRGYGSPITVIHKSFAECIRLYTNIILKTDEDVLKIIEKLATRANKAINIAKPYLEFSLPEGHRVAATINNEISLPGSTFDIRKFPAKPLSITYMIANETLDSLVAAYLWFLMEYKPFIIIMGPTGSGKTSLLNAILNMVNSNYKVLTIEDTPEINIANGNWVRFISRSTLSGNFDVSLGDLAKLSLRYRPDYLVIGEVRGKEIEALIHASASGHGSLTTFHGSRPLDAFTRITDLLSSDLSKLFLQTVWAFIILGNRKYNDKSIRGVLSIYETVVDKQQKIKFKKVIEWDYNKNSFSPSDVISLIRKSYRLKWIGKTYGLSRSEIIEEIQKRSSYLSKLIQENTLDFLEVSSRIRSFYAGEVQNENKVVS